MVRAIQFKNVTSGIQQGGCSSSTDRPLSIAVWGPAGPLDLCSKLVFIAGSCPEEGKLEGSLFVKNLKKTASKFRGGITKKDYLKKFRLPSQNTL